jgi:hypothetical protein
VQVPTLRRAAAARRYAPSSTAHDEARRQRRGARTRRTPAVWTARRRASGRSCPATKAASPRVATQQRLRGAAHAAAAQQVAPRRPRPQATLRHGSLSSSVRRSVRCQSCALPCGAPVSVTGSRPRLQSCYQLGERACVVRLYRSLRRRHAPAGTHAPSRLPLFAPVLTTVVFKDRGARGPTTATVRRQSSSGAHAAAARTARSMGDFDGAADARASWPALLARDAVDWGMNALLFGLAPWTTLTVRAIRNFLPWFVTYCWQYACPRRTRAKEVPWVRMLNYVVPGPLT